MPQMFFQRLLQNQLKYAYVYPQMLLPIPTMSTSGQEKAREAISRAVTKWTVEARRFQVWSMVRAALQQEGVVLGESAAAKGLIFSGILGVLFFIS